MEYIVVHIAGAVYSLSDMIIFEILQKVGDQMYMQMIVQVEDVLEDIYVFKWSEIPKEIMEIYDYVNSKSTIERNILFGTHIARKENRNYGLINFKENPIGKYGTIRESIEYDPSIFTRMLRILKCAKNLQ